MSFSSQATNDLKAVLDSGCADAEKGLPGVVGIVVGKDGTELFAHAAASCTKMITGVACMQLVEQGKLRLDDPSQVEELCPELKDVRVLQPDGSLVAKKRGISLRMLLTHTAGFGYTFFHEGLRDYSKPVGFDEFSGHLRDIIQPLVHQPGDGWQYGVGIDWAGFCVERTTKQSLNDYFHQHIFSPLGLKNISMFPHASMKENLAYMNGRKPDGGLFPRDHLLHRPLVVTDQADIASCVNSGGAGCFAKPQDYCQILAMLLNDGTSPTTAEQILRKETVDMMFQNHISSFPEFGRQGIPPAKADLTNAIPDLYPGQQQGWGLTFMLSDGPTGRSPTTGHWAGLPNLYWWCDRAKGVAGMVCCQLLPFADAQVLNLWVAVESAAYKALA